MKRATISDVACLAGVSKSAVSRYFNNPMLINKEYQKKIKSAVLQLGYKPSSSARNLRLGNTNVVGYVMPDISQEFFASTMKSLNDKLFEKNCLLISCDTNNDPKRERESINMLLSQDVLAMVVVTCGNNTAFLKELSEKYKNLILLIRDEPSVNCDCIYEDQEENTYKLTKHMIKKGCKNFGVLYGVPYSSASLQGIEGIKRALAESGILIKNENLIANCCDYYSSKKACEDLLNKNTDIDCVLYLNQKSTEGAYSAVKKHNKNHREVQIAGFASSSRMQTLDSEFPAIIEDPIPVGKLLANFTMQKIFAEEADPTPIKLKIECVKNF